MDTASRRRRVGWSQHAIERLVCALAGIDGAAAHIAANGSIASIVVTPAAGIAEHQIIQNVTSALLAGLGIVLDPARVVLSTSSAPPAAPAPPTDRAGDGAGQPPSLVARSDQGEAVRGGNDVAATQRDRARPGHYSADVQAGSAPRAEVSAGARRNGGPPTRMPTTRAGTRSRFETDSRRHEPAVPPNGASRAQLDGDRHEPRARTSGPSRFPSDNAQDGKRRSRMNSKRAEGGTPSVPGSSGEVEAEDLIALDLRRSDERANNHPSSRRVGRRPYQSPPIRPPRGPGNGEDGGAHEVAPFREGAPAQRTAPRDEAQAVASIDRPSDEPAIAPRIELVELQRVDTQLRCRVVIALADNRFVAIAEGTNIPGADVDLPARAAADALRTARTPAAPIQLEGAVLTDIGGRRHVVASLGIWTGDSFEPAAGAAPVERSVAEAAVAAVLHAATTRTSRSANT